MISAQALLAGYVTAGNLADNALSTATKAATGNQRHFILGCIADYSAAVALIKTVEFKAGGVTLGAAIRWDFSNGPLILALPGVIHGGDGQAVSVELQASGTAGITGRVQLYTFTE